MKGLKYQLKIRAGKSLCGEKELFPPGQPSSSPTFPAPEGDRQHGFCHRGWKFPSEGPEAPGSCVLVFLAARAKKGDRTWALAASSALDGRAAAPMLLSLADLRVKQGASLVVVVRNPPANPGT